MKIVATPIPNNSHGVRVWLNQPPGDDDTGEPYEFACNLCRIDEEHCEVSQAIGELSNDVAILIGLKAIELGYKHLTFSRTAGGNATRWARHIRTEGGFDHYDVDLSKALKIYEGMQ